MRNFIIIILFFSSFTSCVGKFCENYTEEALVQPRDKDLVGLWKLKQESKYETSLYLYEADGYHRYESSIKDIKDKPKTGRIWYTKNDILYKFSCNRLKPDIVEYKYELKDKNTLHLYNYQDNPEKKSVYIRQDVDMNIFK